MNSSPESNLLPTVTAVVEDVFMECENKLKYLLDDIKTFNELLRPIVCKSEVNNPCTSTGYKNAKSSIAKLQSRQEGSPEKTCLAQQLLDKGVPKEFNDALNSIDYYLQSRTTPTEETEKKKFLDSLHCSWDEEYKTYQIFEPDLGEALKRYLAVIEEHSPPAEIPVLPTKRMMDVATAVKKEEEAIQTAQERINKALTEDLSKIDLCKLKGDQKMLVGLHRLITALSDITQLRSKIIVHGDTWKQSTGD